MVFLGEALDQEDGGVRAGSVAQEPDWTRTVLWQGYSLPIGNCFLMTFTPGIPTSRLALEGNPPEPNLVENVVNMLKRGRVILLMS